MKKTLLFIALCIPAVCSASSIKIMGMVGTTPLVEYESVLTEYFIDSYDNIKSYKIDNCTLDIFNSTTDSGTGGVLRSLDGQRCTTLETVLGITTIRK